MTAQRVGKREIHCGISAVYGEHSISALSSSRVLEWYKRFRERRVSLKDDARLGQQSDCVITPAIIVAVDGPWMEKSTDHC